MSGHSKWANIKHRKASVDAKKGRIFSKLIREITIAARIGGEDLNSNIRLRTAVMKARGNNMPNENIERAIKKGTGALEGESYEEVRYEGYGPGGVAIMIDCLTDNKNRTTPQIRTIFSKNGGNLGESGCVAYNFERKGMIIVESGQSSEDEIMELLIDYDIEDIRTEDGNIVVITTSEGYADIYEVLKGKEFELSFSEISFIPNNTIHLDEKKAIQCLKLIQLLEDQDDVQNVYSNYDVPDEVMTRISEAQ